MQWPLAAAVAVALACVAVFGVAGLAGLALAPLAVALGLARHRSAGAALADGRVVLRRRRLARMTLVADARRLQDVERGETLLTRRAHLASLGVGVASGTHVAVRYLERGAVDELMARLVGLAR